MGRHDAFTVEISMLGRRLDQFLHERYPETSRGEVQRLIGEGCVQVNGKAPKASQKPKSGDVITIEWPDPVAADVVAQDIPLDLLFEDDDLLVLDKPPGLVVHPAAGHADGTLVNALLHHCAGNLSGIGGVARPGIVHRIDRDTSGCLVVAKNDTAHRALQAAFAARQVDKRYHCLLCGDIQPPEGELRGRIARHPIQRKRMTVTEGPGREALTTYRRIGRLSGASWVEARIHTGRTHQVRVHFQDLGFPLVGDLVYGERANRRLATELGWKAPRQMLHARTLAFAHPRSGQTLSFEAPLPADFQDVLQKLGGTPSMTASPP